MKRSQAEQREFSLNRCRQRCVPFPIWPEDAAAVGSIVKNLPRLTSPAPFVDGWAIVAEVYNCPEHADFLIPGYGYAVLSDGVRIGRFKRVA